MLADFQHSFTGHWTINCSLKAPSHRETYVTTLSCRIHDTFLTRQWHVFCATLYIATTPGYQRGSIRRQAPLSQASSRASGVTKSYRQDTLPLPLPLYGRFTEMPTHQRCVLINSYRRLQKRPRRLGSTSRPATTSHCLTGVA